MRSFLVAGASRGIDKAVATYYASRVETLYTVSRTRADNGRWIQADLATNQGVARVSEVVAKQKLDAFLYMGGTWEDKAFTSDYDFETCTDEDIARVLNVNLLAPIRLTRALLPALRQSDNPKIIFMGALSGRDNFPAREVANSASKFGLRGAVHALREELRQKQIGVTVINPGNVATPEVLSDLGEDAVVKGLAIPLSDLLALIDCVLSLSRASCVKEIDLPAMRGKDA